MVNYSIIIPVKAINEYIRETTLSILALDIGNWELIILPNEQENNEWQDKRIKILSSGRVGPAEKRDIGARNAAGEILVFLDDDSYPNQDLLSVAAPYFKNTEIVAIGGPAITPASDSFWQKVSGAVFLSRLSGGNPERYIPIGEPREVDDWPSVNFMIRKKDFLEIGGFDTAYWPGEDTKLCFDLITKAYKKIIYVPNLIVWHHRRSGLLSHLKQVGGYGLHRGYFAKVYPKTSRKFKYLIPSLFSLFVIASFGINTYPQFIKNIFILGWILYAFALFKSFYDMRKYEKRLIAFTALFYVVITHFWYGVRFIEGLYTNKLVSRLR